jgi:hypothetical protein
MKLTELYGQGEFVIMGEVGPAKGSISRDRNIEPRGKSNVHINIVLCWRPDRRLKEPIRISQAGQQIEHLFYRYFELLWEDQ